MPLHDLVTEYCQLAQSLRDLNKKSAMPANTLSVQAINTTGVSLNETSATRITTLQQQMNETLVVLRTLLNSEPMSINAKNVMGETPLHIAVRHNNERMVRFLRLYDANLEIENAAKMTPFECALYHPDASPIIDAKSINDSVSNPADSQANTQPILDEKVMASQSFTLAQLLAKWGADCERKKSNGTLLHAAMREKNFRKAAVLLMLGADCQGYYDEELPATTVQCGISSRAIPRRRKVTIFILLQELNLPPEWWKLLLSYGAGINADWNTLALSMVIKYGLIENQFLYRLTYSPEIRSSKMANKSTDIFKQACFSADDLRENITKGIVHNLDAYLKVFDGIIKKGGVSHEWIKSRDALTALNNSLSKVPSSAILQADSQAKLLLSSESISRNDRSPEPLTALIRHWLFQPDNLAKVNIPENLLDELQDIEEAEKRNRKKSS